MTRTASNEVLSEGFMRLEGLLDKMRKEGRSRGVEARDGEKVSK